MKSVLYLVKKDYILIKYDLMRIAGIVVAVSSILRFLLDSSFGEINNLVVLLISVVYAVFFAHAYLMKVKFKYDGDTLLILTSYARRQLVFANYLFTLISFLVAIGMLLLEFWILHAIFGTQMLSFWMISVTFLMVSLMISLVIPLEYQFGLMHSQTISGVIIFMTPLLLTIVMKLPGSLHLLMHLSSPLISLFLLIAGLVIALFSLRISISIFNKKDL